MSLLIVQPIKKRSCEIERTFPGVPNSAHAQFTVYVRYPYRLVGDIIEINFILSRFIVN